jgi:hypothetical protein
VAFVPARKNGLGACETVRNVPTTVNQMTLGARRLNEVDSIVQIKIVRRPMGEAPEWVRDAWIGMSLPLVTKKPRRVIAFGVLSGPQNYFPQLWAWATGKSLRVTGYVVNAKTAVDCLAVVQPDAAEWWRTHTRVLLDGRRNFMFETDACEHVPSE